MKLMWQIEGRLGPKADFHIQQKTSSKIWLSCAEKAYKLYSIAVPTKTGFWDDINKLADMSARTRKTLEYVLHTHYFAKYNFVCLEYLNIFLIAKWQKVGTADHFFTLEPLKFHEAVGISSTEEEKKPSHESGRETESFGRKQPFCARFKTLTWKAERRCSMCVCFGILVTTFIFKYLIQ